MPHRPAAAPQRGQLTLRESVRALSTPKHERQLKVAVNDHVRKVASGWCLSEITRYRCNLLH